MEQGGGCPWPIDYRVGADRGQAEQFSPELSWRSGELIFLIVIGREGVRTGGVRIRMRNRFLDLFFQVFCRAKKNDKSDKKFTRGSGNLRILCRA